MKKKNNSKKEVVEEVKHFGTHSDMVIDIDNDNDVVIAKDNDGYYYTTTKNVNSGLLDTYRHPSYNRVSVPDYVIENINKK